MSESVLTRLAREVSTTRTCAWPKARCTLVELRLTPVLVEAERTIPALETWLTDQFDRNTGNDVDDIAWINRLHLYERLMSVVVAARREVARCSS